MSGDLKALAARAGRELEWATAEEILRWAVETFGDRFCIASSMADGVLVHLAARVKPGIDVVFLDTGYHFAETIRTRDAVAAANDVNVVTVQPEQSVPEQDAAYGTRLHDRDPDLCCALRKVAPLEKALAGRYDSWATGLRREQSLTRSGTRVVTWDAGRGKVKVSPMARWTRQDVDRYVAEHQVVQNPLLSEGYASIGCAPCTRRVAVGSDPRSGRWSGFTKTECGIHR
ncbi:MAG: phosphoadenylyl-sulfate reductase [Streptomycetales bacterium]